MKKKKSTNKERFSKIILTETRNIKYILVLKYLYDLFIDYIYKINYWKKIFIDYILPKIIKFVKLYIPYGSKCVRFVIFTHIKSILDFDFFIIKIFYNFKIINV